MHAGPGQGSTGSVGRRNVSTVYIASSVAIRLLSTLAAFSAPSQFILPGNILEPFAHHCLYLLALAPNATMAPSISDLPNDLGSRRHEITRIWRLCAGEQAIVYTGQTHPLLQCGSQKQGTREVSPQLQTFGICELYSLIHRMDRKTISHHSIIVYVIIYRSPAIHPYKCRSSWLSKSSRREDCSTY